MSERKPCIRCGRAIDAWAKICPFCNWNQDAPVPAQAPPQPVEVAEYKPPQEFDLKKKAIGGGIGVLVLVAAFGVGMLVNRDGAPKNAPPTVEEQLEDDRRAAVPVTRADTPLVPTNERGGIEQPITSAPVAAQPGMAPDDWQRTDATAVSATEYNEMAKRAKAERERMAALVDPRSLTGPAYAQAPRAVRPRPAASPAPGAAPQQVEPQARRTSVRTRPVPQYQPLPEIRARGTARLSLLIGADGRVKEVGVSQSLRGGTSDLVRAVQSWRFKPATENGEPVAAPYTVEISFR